jgi:hypothetical protein
MGNSAKKIAQSNAPASNDLVDSEIERRQIEKALQDFCARRGRVWRRPQSTSLRLNNVRSTRKGEIKLTVRNTIVTSSTAMLKKVNNVNSGWKVKINNLYPDLSEFM